MDIPLFRREAVEQAAPSLHGRTLQASQGNGRRRIRRRMPIVLQTEFAECGLACLAMVASHWGHRADLRSLRRRFELSLKGCTLRSLIDMARQLGLLSRPIKLELQQLCELPLPCILHWDMNHFVVLAAIERQYIVIYDPAVGRRRLRLSEVSQHFTGVALELRPGPEFATHPRLPRISVRSLMGPLVGLRSGLARGLILTLTLQACALITPFYLQWVIDRAIAHGDRAQIAVLGAGFLLVAGARAAFGAIRSWTMTALATSLNYQWLSNTFAHLMRLPLTYFEKRHAADIVSRFNSIQTIQHSLTTQFVEGLVDGLLAAAALGLMAFYSLTLTAIAGAAMTGYALLRWNSFRSLRETTSQQMIHTARQQSHFLESVRHVASLRLFDHADVRRISWSNRLADQFNAELRVARLSIALQASQVVLSGAAHVLIVWLAALAILQGRLSVGMLFAFVAYKEHFSQSVSALIDKLFELRLLGLHTERVADIVLSPIEAEPPLDEPDPETSPPGIELRGVGFRYADGEAYVLRHLDLVIPAGECIAITGASGCGKTTLAKLLLGLLDPTEGQILVGGRPLPQIGAARYRRRVAAVLQDDALFTGSIADNISFFDPDAQPERVAACAKQAAIDAEIRAMPMGYRTLIGEAGGGLSGGQKQRILLARALYKAPAVLVLDEATSHLDLVNERCVNAAISRSKLTRVLIAHRPETIAMARRVVVLADGRIECDFAQVPNSHPEDA